jgi:phosphoadenosine phosphosulfate reductase
MSHAQQNIFQNWALARQFTQTGAGFDFTQANERLANMSVHERINWAAQQFGEDVILTSSFGVRSIIMIFALRQAQPDLQVAHINIPGGKYDISRDYRRNLERLLKLDVLTINAPSDALKDEAQETSLKESGFKAFFRGIGQDQTQERGARKFIEPWGDGLIAIAPILDIPKTEIDRQIMALPQALRHPKFKPGIQSKGGAVLNDNEVKTECSLEDRYKFDAHI